MLHDLGECASVNLVSRRNYQPSGVICPWHIKDSNGVAISAHDTSTSPVGYPAMRGVRRQMATF